MRIMPARHAARLFLTRRRPTYLRAVITTACPMRCSYCHMEGDPEKAGHRGGPAPAELDALLRIAARQGIAKFKFLGGEPLIRADLLRRIAALRAAAPAADLSVITAGVTRPGMLEQTLAAGLDRINVSVHGFDLDAFARRGGTLRSWHARNTFLQRVIDAGRPLKVNFVYANPAERADLAGLLDWAAGRPLAVNVLDDLTDDAAGPRHILDLLHELRGPEMARRLEPDPHSLPTTHLFWADGLRVELKDRHLGELGPWSACDGCPARARCREGIFALRLTHDGRLQACMDRPDLSLDIVDVLRAHGEAAAERAWRHFVETL
ncbi:MAG: radical SAM protein [Myxococcales bacterium]|nr:radical SAM protein [Myxococcales bacterium]